MVKSATLNLPGGPVDVGETIKVYRQGMLSRIFAAIRLVVLLALVVGLGLLFFFYLGIARGLLPNTWRDLLVTLSLLGLAGLVAIPVVPDLYHYAQHWHDVAVEYSNGIAYYHMAEWRTLRWEEIVEVARRRRSASWNYWGSSSSLLDSIPLLMPLLLSDTRRYDICATARSPICMSGTLSEIDSLVDVIEARTRCYREERAIAELQAGMDVPFGSVSVNMRRGIQRDGKWYAWQSVSLVDNIVMIAPTQELLASMITIKQSEIPNGDVLCDLVAHRSDWSLQMRRASRQGKGKKGIGGG